MEQHLFMYVPRSVLPVDKMVFLVGCNLEGDVRALDNRDVMVNVTYRGVERNRI